MDYKKLSRVADSFIENKFEYPWVENDLVYAVDQDDAEVKAVDKFGDRVESVVQEGKDVNKFGDILFRVHVKEDFVGDSFKSPQFLEFKRQIDDIIYSDLDTAFIKTSLPLSEEELGEMIDYCTGELGDEYKLSIEYRPDTKDYFVKIVDV